MAESRPLELVENMLISDMEALSDAMFKKISIDDMDEDFKAYRALVVSGQRIKKLKISKPKGYKRMVCKLFQCVPADTQRSSALTHFEISRLWAVGNSLAGKFSKLWVGDFPNFKMNTCFSFVKSLF